MILRLANKNDFEEFYYLKCDDSNVYWTGWENKPNKENLKSFLFDAIDNNKTIKNRKIYMAEIDQAIVGYVYIDYVSDNTFCISPSISSKFQGKGLGKEIIRLVVKEGKKIGFSSAIALIRQDNIASIKSFTANGFVKSEKYTTKYISNIKREIRMDIYYLDCIKAEQ